MSQRLFPELPSREEMWVPAILWARDQMREHGHYHTDRLKEHLAKMFNADTTLVFESTGRPAWSNYVDWVTAEMTRHHLHTGGNKVYHMTPKGVEKAEQYARDPKIGRQDLEARKQKTAPKHAA